MLAFIFNIKGSIDLPLYKKGKAYFKHVYNQYNRKAIKLAKLERIRLENAAINAQDNRSQSPEVKGQED